MDALHGRRTESPAGPARRESPDRRCVRPDRGAFSGRAVGGGGSTGRAGTTVPGDERPCRQPELARYMPRKQGPGDVQFGAPYGGSPSQLTVGRASTFGKSRRSGASVHDVFACGPGRSRTIGGPFPIGGAGETLIVEAGDDRLCTYSKIGLISARVPLAPQIRPVGPGRTTSGVRRRERCASSAAIPTWGVRLPSQAIRLCSG